MQGRTWKKVDKEKAKKIKFYLLENGGIEREAKGQYEEWRVSFSDSIFTFYSSGTLFISPSPSNDPAIDQTVKYVDALVDFSYKVSSKKYLIGLDETGKGELVGHTILTGVIFPIELFDRIVKIVGTSDTKKKHSFEYWDTIFKDLDGLRNLGFDFLIERVPPWHIDRFNLNKLMDISYQKVLSIFLRRANINETRIVLDDYGIGPTLKRFLNFLEKQGADVIASTRSEDIFIEAKTASLISKRVREAVIKAINQNEEFKINGLTVGSGNAGNQKTLEWLKKWHDSGRQWPWFIKRSFKTIWELEGKSSGPKKVIPPIKDNLLSKEFVQDFNQGRLSISALSVVCPNCGSITKSVTFAISKVKCPSCNKFIENISMTLRYYCGYVIPDSNIITGGLLSKDLKEGRFFENYNIIIVPIVQKECDTPGGKKEFQRLGEFGAMSRIKLEFIGNVRDIPKNLSNLERDELIVQNMLDLNAIALTADNQMKACTVGKNIFTISV